MRPHLEVDEYLIVVQSCNEKTANIGVFENKSVFKRKSFYAHVHIPFLARVNDEPQYYTELRKEIYDSVLAKYKSEIISLIHALNEEETQKT